MSVNENLRNNVAEKNIENIRGCLWSCIVVDPNLTSEFKESLGYVLANGITEAELYEADDDKSFGTEPTQENFAKLGGMIRSNFSKKKLDALGKMGRVLYPPITHTIEKAECNASDSGSCPQQRTQRNPTVTIGGAVLGAVAGAIIGKIAFDGAIAVLGGIAIGAAAGAIAGTVLSKKN